MGFTVGGTHFTRGLCLAPMAGYSDHAMRLLCHSFGAEYAVTEMVSAKALCYGDRRTAPLARIGRDEGAVAVQIFGSEPAVMAEAARRIEEGFAGGEPPLAIDINMGCPVHKIVSNGEGSALMRDEALAARIVEAVVGAVSLPVTVKIRAGWDGESKNAPSFARTMAEAGASLITVHGRTRGQMYSGAVDREVIARTVDAVDVPVLASGDVKDGESARLMLETGCAGLMIGRAAVGNPFVFAEIASALDGVSYVPPTLAARLDTAYRAVLLAAEEKGELAAVREARKQWSGCLHGYKGAAAFRRELHLVTTLSEMRALFDRTLEGEE